MNSTYVRHGTPTDLFVAVDIKKKGVDKELPAEEES
jgi:hypothetical protein